MRISRIQYYESLDLRFSYWRDCVTSLLYAIKNERNNMSTQVRDCCLVNWFESGENTNSAVALYKNYPRLSLWVEKLRKTRKGVWVRGCVAATGAVSSTERGILNGMVGTVLLTSVYIRRTVPITVPYVSGQLSKIGVVVSKQDKIRHKHACRHIWNKIIRIKDSNLLATFKL